MTVIGTRFHAAAAGALALLGAHSMALAEDGGGSFVPPGYIPNVDPIEIPPPERFEPLTAAPITAAPLPPLNTAPAPVRVPAPLVQPGPPAAARTAAKPERCGPPRYCAPVPQDIAYAGVAVPGSIIIQTAQRRLLLVTGPDTAREYAIAVGRTGVEMPQGSYKIGRKKEGPIWYPTENMRMKNPSLPKLVPPGPSNPLGTHALYLVTPAGHDDLYRIHGTNEPWTVGKSSSSGCFRMNNADVADLFNRVAVDASVTVTAAPSRPLVSSASQTHTQPVRTAAPRPALPRRMAQPPETNPFKQVLGIFGIR